MASPLQIEAFEQAQDRVWKKLTPKEKGELAGTCTIHDVWEVTQKIQKEQAGRGMLGNMNKIRPYLDGLNRYGDVIAVFVSVKPDILGLIWGPIKLLLQLASNYFQGYDKLLDVFHEIGSSLPQFQQIEEIFHNQGSDQIANYLSLFYTEIVEFHYQALRFFRQTRWRALFEVLWPRYEEIFTAIHRNIEKHKGLIDRQVNILTIKEARQESQEALKRYQEERDFRELCKLEKNISHFDYTPRLYDIQSRYCADTGKWIFTDNRFRAWLDAGSNEAKERLLWLAGVPGAGKTFLCYSILQYLQERAQADGSTCVLYAFPTYDNASGSTQAAITGSLVYQFCQANPPLIPAANKEYDTLSRRSILLNPWGKLLETLICGSEPVYIILDGLDECDQSQRKQLLETVLNLCSSCPNLHVLVASRKEFDIRRELEKNCEIVIVEDKNRADIKRFVTGKINNLWNEIKHVAEPEASDFFKEVARDIVVRSGGMFLYARLTIAHLEGQSTVPQIMAEAYNLPRDLDEIYGRILDRIATILSASEQAVVKRIFSWLICARRPLRSIELEHALLFQPGDTKLEYNRAPYKDLLALCGPIVEKRNEYLTFVHFSAKGYLTEESLSGSHSIPRFESQTEVAVACLSYLCFRYFDSNISDEEVDQLIAEGGYVLHEYAQSNFLHHIRSAWRAADDASERLAISTREFLETRWNPSFQHQDSQILSNSSTLGQLQSKYPEELRKLNIIAACLAHRITGNSEVNSKQEPLILNVISHRITERFELLVSALCSGRGHAACASLHKHYGSELFRCPIISCSRHRHGFETRAKRDYHVAKHQRPFKCDVANCDFSSVGFESEADKADHILNCHEVSSYKQTEATLDDMDDEACYRVLCSAAREGELGLVHSLLSLLTPKITWLGGFGKLLRAAGEGQSADVIDLVCKTALGFVGLNVVRKELEDELYRAIVSGSKEFVHALCRNKFCAVMGLNVTSTRAVSGKGYKFPSGLAPVHLAVLRQSAAIVEHLLEAGANADVLATSGTQYGNHRALHLAAREGNEAVLRLLLDYGANLETETSFDLKYIKCTALHIATLQGHEGIVRLLLDRGVRINAQASAALHPSNSTTALNMATEIGSEAIVWLLLDHGADIEDQRHDGRTALQYAVENRQEAIIRLLLEYRANIEVMWQNDRTALQYAVEKGQEAIVRLLLDSGANVEAKSPDGCTALQYAVENGQEAIVRLLLDRGANIEAEYRDGSTALHKAVSFKNEAMVQLLHDLGADIEAKKGEHSGTALHEAVRIESEVMVRLLLDLGANIEAKKGGDGDTALHEAIRIKSEVMVRLLLELGANIEAKKGEDGKTALHEAIRIKSESMVLLLLDLGANIEAKNGGNGETALNQAIRIENEAMYQLLLDCGANIEEVKGESLSTALFWAVNPGNEAMVRLLLELGANIEAKNGEHGETVLHRAARNASKAVVQFLLHHGADIQAKDRWGWTPLYYAKLYGNADVERLLLDRGAADFVDPRDIFSS